MPEHVHLLLGEPRRSTLSIALQVLKQQTSHKLKKRGRFSSGSAATMISMSGAKRSASRSCATCTAVRLRAAWSPGPKNVHGRASATMRTVRLEWSRLNRNGQRSAEGINCQNISVTLKRTVGIRALPPFARKKPRMGHPLHSQGKGAPPALGYAIYTVASDLFSIFWDMFAPPQFKGSSLPRPGARGGLGATVSGIPNKDNSVQKSLGQTLDGASYISGAVHP